MLSWRGTTVAQQRKPFASSDSVSRVFRFYVVNISSLLSLAVSFSYAFSLPRLTIAAQLLKSILSKQNTFIRACVITHSTCVINHSTYQEIFHPPPIIGITITNIIIIIIIYPRALRTKFWLFSGCWAWRVPCDWRPKVGCQPLGVEWASIRLVCRWSRDGKDCWDSCPGIGIRRSERPKLQGKVSANNQLDTSDGGFVFRYKRLHRTLNL